MKLLIILGLPRGGTSAAAALAAGLGVPMSLPGDMDPPPPDVAARYPQGNLEDKTFRELAWKTTELDHSREYPFACYRHFTRRWKDSLNDAESASFREWSYRRATHAASLGKSVFGVKLPGACSIITPLVKCFAEDKIESIVFFVNRPVADSIDSLCNKRGVQNEPLCPMAWASAVQWYNNYHLTKAKISLSQCGTPTYDVSFRQIITEPAAAASVIASRCGIPFRPEAVAAVDRSLHSSLPELCEVGQR